KTISLEIILDDFNGIMHGNPEESLGCKLKGKLVLKIQKTISPKQLLFVFVGKSTVSCGLLVSSSNPEYRESHTIYRKQCVFHNSRSSNRKIPPGTYEYGFDFDIPGNLPSSFKGARGKIEYSCNAILSRPLFHSNILVKKPVILKRCLINDAIPLSNLSNFAEGVLDSRIQFQISTPIMAFREGGLVSAKLNLKPLDSDSFIESIEYGLKEQTHYHTTESYTRTFVASVKEDKFPLGKKTISLDQLFHDSSDPISIDFRLCPWVNCDLDSQLINVKHKLAVTIKVVGNISSDNSTDNDDLDSQDNDSTSHIGRRFSSPAGSPSTDLNSRRRSFRTLSLLPPKSRTFSISSYLQSHKKSVRNSRNEQLPDNIKFLNFEIPLIITTKSDIPRQQAPSYSSVDEPPAYIYASMIPPPPEYCYSESITDEKFLSRFLNPEMTVKTSTLFKYEKPLSPHLAVNKNLVPKDDDVLLATKKYIIECAIDSSLDEGTLFLETAGGTIQSEFYRPLRLPTILIGDSKLGGISTTISSFESLRLRGYDIPIKYFGDLDEEFSNVLKILENWHYERFNRLDEMADRSKEV
ncbi:11029_t:CDS:2, partial [Racocetra persica]